MSVRAISQVFLLGALAGPAVIAQSRTISLPLPIVERTVPTASSVFSRPALVLMLRVHEECRKELQHDVLDGSFGPGRSYRTLLVW
jgi:hypothetical protein